MESLVNRVPVLANRNMSVSFGSLVVERLEEYTLSDCADWFTFYRSNLVSDIYNIEPNNGIWIIIAFDEITCRGLKRGVRNHVSLVCICATSD